MEKAGRVSGFDRIVGRGRAVADRAHRAVALGLIGLTGMSFLPCLLIILGCSIVKLRCVG